MKLNKQTIALLLLICLSAEAIPLSAQTKKKGLKKTANISLNITNKKNFPPKTGLNIGLLSNFSRLNGVGINLISSIVHYKVDGVQISGFANVTGLNVSAFQLAGLANVTGDNSKGILLAGLMNIKRTNPKQRQVIIESMYNNLFILFSPP